MRSQELRLFFFLAGGLLLSACVGSEAGAPRHGLQESVKQESGDSRSKAPLYQAALPPELVIDTSAEDLLGLSDEALLGQLGTPNLRRRESPAEVWQYRAGNCVLDVFLYIQGDAKPSVTYIEARGSDAQRQATQGCLESLLLAQLERS